MIDYKNGTMTIGHAHKNRLVGLARKFDETQKFVSMENVVTGDCTEIKDNTFF